MIEKIYIPSLGRFDRQITWENLPEFLKERAVLVVQPAEQDLHGDKPVLVLPENDCGIHNTRKFIWEHAQGKIHIVADDDLQFRDRNSGYGINLTKEDADYSYINNKTKEPMTEENWRFFEETTCQWFEEGVAFSGMKLGSFSPTMWHNGYVNNTSVFCFYVFNGKILPEADKLDWSLQLAEDAHLVLQLLRKGYSNRIWDKFCVQSSQFTKGGCNTYRTIDDTNRSHIELCMKHPDYVELNGYPKRIGDIQKVKVRWNKAYKDYIKKGIGEII
jgi:hypothetical protein